MKQTRFSLSQETIAIVTVGVALAGFNFAYFGDMRAEMRAEREAMRAEARAEREAFGNGPDHDESLAAAMASAMTREGRKLAYHLPRLAGLFVLTLIPIVNVAAPLLWFAFGAWMLALHFVDYASENRGLKLDDTIALLRANPGPTFGFGAVIALLMAVPFAALVVIPVAVCGGAVLWRRLA